MALRGDSKAKPPTSLGHVSQRWEDRGLSTPPTSHPNCRVPAPITAWHWAATPPTSPCCRRDPVLAPLVVPQLRSPQNPSGMPRCQSHGWQQDASDGTLAPSLSSPVWVQPWPSSVPTVPKPWQRGKRRAGELVGLRAPYCGSPGVAGTPGSPLLRGCPPGCGLGTSQLFAPPMPQLVPLPPLEHVAIYHLAQLLYLADQN